MPRRGLWGDHGVKRWLRLVRSVLREINGDAAYEAHARRARRRSVRPLSRGELYLERLRRRYAGASRCC